MKISFLENGLNSLQKGYINLQEYEKVYYLKRNTKSEKERFYLLKDAILFVQHGVEILFKYILIRENELLVFTNLDKQVKMAYEEKIKNNIQNVFEVSDKYKLHTISFSETIDRLEKFTKTEFSTTLKGKLHKIESYRNQIMHSEVYLFEQEIHSVFDGLIGDIDMLLYNSLGSEYKMITGFSELIKSHNKLSNEIKEYKKSLQHKVIQQLLNICAELGITIGEDKFTRITDINIATKFIERLFTKEFEFGADLSNGFCTGEVGHLKRISQDDFEMLANDNGAKYIFKFESLIIYTPKIQSKLSPLLFFECSENDVDKSMEDCIEFDQGVKITETIELIDSKRELTNKDEINRFYSELNAGMRNDDFFTIHRYLSKGIFCFINFIGLDYYLVRNILWNYHSLDGKTFEVLIRERFKID